MHKNRAAGQWLQAYDRADRFIQATAPLINTLQVVPSSLDHLAIKDEQAVAAVP